MDRVMQGLRAIVWPAIIFVPLYFGLQFGLGQWVQNEDIIRPDVITRITQQLEAAPSSDAGVLDASAQGGADPLTVQIQSIQGNILTGLSGWAFGICAAGLALSLLWSLHAFWREQRAFGPRAQRAALPAWFIAALAYGAADVAIFFMILNRLRLTEVMTLPYYFGAVLLIGALGLLCYWLATALAASPVMKPSVPLGTKFAR